jgi:4-hydroxy-tetrahydrodipicolinate synthase
MKTLAAGVWGVLPTPFDAGASAVDIASLHAAVQMYRSLAQQPTPESADGPSVAGVVVLGVFGEAARLDRDERVQVMREVALAAAGLAVVAGITFTDTDPAAAEAKLVAQSAPGRVSAVMVQVNSADPAVLARHLTAVHEACGLPIVVQDYPVSTGVHISATALAETVQRLPFVAAVKCESPPTSLAIARLSALVGHVPLFGGLGGVGLLDELCAGAAGAMTGFSYPEALVAVVRAFRVGGFSAAHEAIRPWLPLMNFEGQAAIGLAIRKENLRRRGVLATNAVRNPGQPFPAELATCVHEHIRHVPTLER